MSKRRRGRRPKPRSHRVRLPEGYARSSRICECQLCDCPPPEIVELGSGPHCYIRTAWDFSYSHCFRFETEAEMVAAHLVGAALDHIQGAPPELVEAIFEAARSELLDLRDRGLLEGRKEGR